MFVEYFCTNVTGLDIQYLRNRLRN